MKKTLACILFSFCKLCSATAAEAEDTTSIVLYASNDTIFHVFDTATITVFGNIRVSAEARSSCCASKTKELRKTTNYRSTRIAGTANGSTTKEIPGSAIATTQRKISSKISLLGIADTPGDPSGSVERMECSAAISPTVPAGRWKSNRSQLVQINFYQRLAVDFIVWKQNTIITASGLCPKIFSGNAAFGYAAIARPPTC